MSTEGSADDPKCDLWVEDTIHGWDKSTITLAEIRELGAMPADSPVSPSISRTARGSAA